jgi:hypothetical protein
MLGRDDTRRSMVVYEGRTVGVEEEFGMRVICVGVERVERSEQWRCVPNLYCV